ncbi:MAG TPA: hypothetical protein VF605_09950 [Allosphingosinicella sp.]|jgi:hypothetical protein
MNMPQQNYFAFDCSPERPPDYDTGVGDSDHEAQPSMEVERDYKRPGSFAFSPDCLTGLTPGRWFKDEETHGDLTYKCKAKYDARSGTRYLTVRIFKAGTQRKIAVEKYPERSKRWPW